MPELLTNILTGDGYTEAATIGPASAVEQLTFQCFNEPVLVRLFKPVPGQEGVSVEEAIERYFPAGALVQFTGVSGAAFRSANLGAPSTINAEIAFATDPISSYSSTGLFSSAVLSLGFDHNGAPIGFENVADFVDSTNLFWTLVDTPGTKMTVSADIPKVIFFQPFNALILQNFLVNGDASPAFEIFAQGAQAWGPGGAGPLDLEIARVAAGANAFLEMIKGDGFGYGTGTGGTALATGAFPTQTATINKATGIITTGAGGSLAPGTNYTLTVTNSVVAATDTIIVNWGSAGDTLPIHISHVGAGSFTICMTNQNSFARTIAANLAINFTVLKGANS